MAVKLQKRYSFLLTRKLLLGFACHLAIIIIQIFIWWSCPYCGCFLMWGSLIHSSSGLLQNPSANRDKFNSVSNPHARWRIFGPHNSFCHSFHSLIPLVFHPEEAFLSLHNRMEIVQKSALISSMYSTPNLKVIWNSFFSSSFLSQGQLNLITMSWTVTLFEFPQTLWMQCSQEQLFSSFEKYSEGLLAKNT